MLSGGLIEKIGTVEAGGRITGDLVIEGDLTVEGSATHVYDQEVQGGMVIDATDTEALLIRKASDGGDVFNADCWSNCADVSVFNASTTECFTSFFAILLLPIAYRAGLSHSYLDLCFKIVLKTVPLTLNQKFYLLNILVQI